MNDSGSARRARRLLRPALRLLPVAILVVAVAGTAQAGPSTKFYGITIAPTTAAAGSTATYTLTLRNSTDSTQTLGSANVSVPSASGFTVTAVAPAAAEGGKTWSATLGSAAVRLRAASSGDALAPGESVSTELTVSTACNATTATWESIAKQSNNFNGPPGNDFARQGADPVLTVTAGGGTLAALVFGQQPSRSEKDSAISPAVTVRGVDVCGNAATGATGEVSIALGTNPSGATLAGTLSKPLVGGVATFGDLTVDRSGLGYTLVASKEALSATSDPFDVVDLLCVSTDAICESEDDGQTTHIMSPAPPAGGTMGFSFSALGGTFTCGGTARAVIGAQTTIDPQGYDAPIQLTFTWDKAVAPGTGVANFVFCLSKDEGASYFEPPACATKKPRPPCEVSRSRTGVGDLEIVILIAPDDPIGSLG